MIRHLVAGGEENPDIVTTKIRKRLTRINIDYQCHTFSFQFGNWWSGFPDFSLIPYEADKNHRKSYVEDSNLFVTHPHCKRDNYSLQVG